MPVRQLLGAGDSLLQGTAGGASIAQGSSGAVFEMAMEALANLPSVGPLISSGNRGCSLGELTDAFDVDYTGSWTDVDPADAWDTIPYGVGKYSAAGATATVMWTKSPKWRTSVGQQITFCDYTGGGNFQYRRDGGAWTNHNQTLLNDNTLIKFYVSGAASTIEFRAYDGAGSVGCFPVAVEWFWLPPSTTQGIIGHNLAAGGHFLSQLVAVPAGGGDRMAIFDDVRLGTGSPIQSTPNAGSMVMVINDVSGTTAALNTNLTAFNTRLSPHGPVGFIVPYEMEVAKAAFATQVAYRAQFHTTATALSAEIIDLYDIYTAMGLGTGSGTQTAAIIAAGLVGDGIHQTPAGSRDQWPRIYWWLRNQFLGIGKEASLGSVAGKRATVGYAGKLATVGYGGGPPLTVD